MGAESNTTAKRLKKIEERLSKIEAETNALTEQLFEQMRAHNQVVKELNEFFDHAVRKQEKPGLILPGKVN